MIVKSNVVVGLVGVEPTTSPLSGVRSNQLSYRPFVHFRNSTIPFRSQNNLVRKKTPTYTYPLGMRLRRRGGEGRTLSSSIIVTRKPPVRSLIRLKSKTISTFSVEPAIARISPPNA